MNRIIKFRAWDKRDKRMLDESEGSNFIVEITAGGVCLFLKNKDDIETGRIVPMQYTGLKDKNRKKIYEGDIVKILERDWPSQLDSFPELSHQQYLDRISSIAEVIFEDGKFKLKTIKMNNYFCGYAGDNNRRDIFEIIGNIYEDSYLLKSRIN